MKSSVFILRKGVIAICLFISLCCKAQHLKINGFVFEAAGKKPLQNVTVVIKLLSNKKSLKTELTDNSGNYNSYVNEGGWFKIEVSFSGYQTQTIDSVLINNQLATVPPVYLSLAPKNLKDITVISKPPFISVKTDKIVLNVAQSPIAAGGNAFDVIKTAPGVMLQGDDLNFRGKSIQFLINGRPTNLSGEDLRTMLSNMQASGIEKIELLPNPSAKYEAAGATVVNIILAKNKQFGTNYVFTSGVGTGKYLRTNTGLDFNYRNKKINVYGGYGFNHEIQYYKTTSTRFIANGIITSKEYEERERNNNSIKLAADYDISKRSTFSVLLNGFINNRNRDVNNNASLHYYTNIADSVSKVFTAGKAVFKNPVVNLYYKIIPDSSGKELTFNADYLNYTKSWYDDFINRYYDSKGDEYIAPDYLKDNSPAIINVYSFAADYVWPTKKARWEMGLKTSYTITDNNVVWETNSGSGWKVDAGKTNHFIYRENVNAAYINYSRSIKKWNVQAGVRAEQTSTKGTSLTIQETNKKGYIDFFPFVQLAYTKNENNEFGFSYRKSIYRFGFDFVNPFIVYQNQYAYSRGNPDLNPQLTHSLSLSYSLKQSVVIGAEFSHSVKSLGVSYSSLNNITVSSYANFKGSDVGYFYLSYTKKLFQLWQMNAYLYGGYFNYNVNTASYTQKQSRDPFYGIQFTNTFIFKKGLSAECNLSYRSKLVTGIFETQPYYYIDAGLSKNISKKGLSFKLSLSDFLNTQVIKLNTDYQGVVTNKNVKAESRFVKLLMRYSFGNKNVKNKRERQSKLSDIKNRIN